MSVAVEMVMDEMIRIDDDKMVCAKELHGFLGVKTFWSTWIQKRIDEYDFKAGYDYLTFQNESRSDFNTLRLSLEMAKEICMVEKTDKGREARKYFIEVEKKWQAARDNMTPAERLLESAKFAVEQERRLAELNKRQQYLESKVMLLGSDTGYRTVRGMAKEVGVKLARDAAQIIGRKASSICKRDGLQLGKVPDERDGMVNSYPVEVLKPVIEAWQAGVL
jgi:phage anti-repressor protein